MSICSVVTCLKMKLWNYHLLYLCSSKSSLIYLSCSTAWFFSFFSWCWILNCNEQLDISYIINIIVQAMINVGLFYAWISTLQHTENCLQNCNVLEKVINLRNTVGKRHKKEFKFIFTASRQHFRLLSTTTDDDGNDVVK